MSKLYAMGLSANTHFYSLYSSNAFFIICLCPFVGGCCQSTLYFNPNCVHVVVTKWSMGCKMPFKIKQTLRLFAFGHQKCILPIRSVGALISSWSWKKKVRYQGMLCPIYFIWMVSILNTLKYKTGMSCSALFFIECILHLCSYVVLP